MQKIKRIKKDLQDIKTFYFLKVTYPNHKGYVGPTLVSYQLVKKLPDASLLTDKNRLIEIKEEFYQNYIERNLTQSEYQEFYHSIKLCQIESTELNFNPEAPHLVIPMLKRVYPKLTIKDLTNIKPVPVNTNITFAYKINE